jgi:precorrin-6A/cobalt-precorrin-6A reductase
MTILLLAGTSDARRLAAALAEHDIPAIASLAGATRTPEPLALPTRRGGFGGPEGFSAFLQDNGIRAVIDATHPFATHITGRTHKICVAMGVPLLRLERPSWTPGHKDRWTFVADEAEATRLISDDAVVFLATGRQTFPVWSTLRASRVFLRVIDRPADPFPFPGGVVLARPPFDHAAEADLFRRLGITHLVAKDSGAAEARPKLDAARDLGIKVLILRRPPLPPGLVIVPAVEDALAWAQELPFRSRKTN